MTTKTMKTPEILELETAAMAVLWAHPQTSTYEEYRRLFAEFLTNTYFFDAFRLERALIDLDRGEVELPSSLPFART